MEPGERCAQHGSARDPAAVIGDRIETRCLAAAAECRAALGRNCPARVDGALKVLSDEGARGLGGALDSREDGAIVVVDAVVLNGEAVIVGGQQGVARPQVV